VRRALLGYARWTSAERGAFWRALLALAGVRALLRGGSYATTARLLERHASAADRRPGTETVRLLARSVERAARVLPGSTCLAQSLTARWLIHRAGGTAELRFGVAAGRDRPRAHAWLEADGEVLLDTDRGRGYAPLARSQRAPTIPL
jgi:hypothetical protein